MIPTINSIILFNAMPNAQLVLYPIQVMGHYSSVRICSCSRPISS